MTVPEDHLIRHDMTHEMVLSFRALLKGGKVITESFVPKFSAEEQQRLSRVFRTLDSDNNGHLDRAEVTMALRDLDDQDEEAILDEVDTLFDLVDLDGSGAIEEDEFLFIMGFRKKVARRRRRLHQFFQMVDTGNTGFISINDLNLLQESVGEVALTHEEIVEVMKMAGVTETEDASQMQLEHHVIADLIIENWTQEALSSEAMKAFTQEMEQKKQGNKAPTGNDGDEARMALSLVKREAERNEALQLQVEQLTKALLESGHNTPRGVPTACLSPGCDAPAGMIQLNGKCLTCNTHLKQGVPKLDLGAVSKNASETSSNPDQSRISPDPFLHHQANGDSSITHSRQPQHMTSDAEIEKDETAIMIVA
jgi:Ca2+-binding EF-hand superfamily protein